MRRTAGQATRTGGLWVRGVGLVVALAFLCAALPAAEQREGRGTFVTVRGPITSRTVAYLRTRLHSALREGSQVVVLAIHGSGDSEFEDCLKAARMIAQVEGAITVAYVEGELPGHEVLLALAADRIVLHPDATLGPVLLEPEPPGTLRIYSTAYVELLKQKGRDVFAPLIRSMIDPSLRLFYVRVAEGNQALFVTQADRAVRLKDRTVVEERIVVDINQTLKLTARLARRWGLAEALAATREEVAERYGLPLELARREPKVLDQVKAARVEVNGPITHRTSDYLKRKCRELEQRGVNLIFFVIDSPGGLAFVGLELAHFIDRDLEELQTVAFVVNEGLSAAAFLAFGCDELVMAPKARLGDCGLLEVGWGFVRYAPEKVLTDVKQQLEILAKSNGYPVALMHAFVDKDVEVVEALHRKTGARGFFLADQVDRDRWQVVRTVKKEGEFLEVDGETALEYGIAVAIAGSFEQLCELYGVDPSRVIRAAPTWLDHTVYWLTRPAVRFLLMVVGILALWIELKLPGVGLPLITSLVAFTLLFWSLFLHGTATALEILLFILGAGLLAAEVFVIPGTGIFGISGVLLMLVSLILVGQSFVFPANEAEWRELMVNTSAVVGSIVAVVVSAALLARYLPSIPLLSRLTLAPPTVTESGEPQPPTPAGVNLIGAVGEAVTPLRPSGRIRIADEYHDALTRGEFVEAGQSVQVLEVHGNYLVVKPLPKCHSDQEPPPLEDLA